MSDVTKIYDSSQFIDKHGMRTLVREIKKYTADMIQAGYDDSALVNRLGTVVSPPPGKNRWLIFDPDNRKGLIMLAGCTVNLNKLGGEGYLTLEEDTKFAITQQLEAGTEYLVKIGWDAETEKLSLSAAPAATNQNITGVLDYDVIGWFHTLCVDAGTNLTMTIQTHKGWFGGTITSGTVTRVKQYDSSSPYHLAFYSKEVVSVETKTNYSVLTVRHPLAGYAAGDILPESVFCTTFRPQCFAIDGMVYDPDTGVCVDIYLMSGTGQGARSVYNQQHTVSRTYQLMAMDLGCVGKRPLYDHEFRSAAKGSNERTNIVGSTDKSTVGGHSDTAGRRMISAIGCEEMCGYLWQILAEYASVGANSSGLYGPGNDNGAIWYDSCDPDAKFGSNYCVPTNMLAGGSWHRGERCGSSSRTSGILRSVAASDDGARGACDIKTGI